MSDNEVMLNISKIKSDVETLKALVFSNDNVFTKINSDISFLKSNVVNKSLINPSGVFLRGDRTWQEFADTSIGSGMSGSLSVGAIPYCSNATGPVLSDSLISQSGGIVDVNGNMRIGNGGTGFGSYAPIECVQIGDCGLALTGTGTTIGTECYRVSFLKDASGTYHKIGATSHQWTDNNTTNGYASYNAHESYFVSPGVTDDDYSFACWAKHGMTIFPGDLSAGSSPGIDKTLKINGDFYATGNCIAGLNVLVNSNSTYNIFTTRNMSTGLSAMSHITIGNNGSANAFTMECYGHSHATLPDWVRVTNQFNAPLSFGAWGNNDTLVVGNNNVGIGVTAPAAKLDIMQSDSTFQVYGRYSGSAHGVTNILPTDARWGIITSEGTDSNAVYATRFIAASENITALSIESISPESSIHAGIVLDASNRNGINRSTMDAGYLLLSIQNNGSDKIQFFSEGVVNPITGYKINGSATSGHYLRGNGTNYVDGAIQAGDIPDLSGTYLTGGGLIDYSATSTIVGFSSIGIKQIMYQKIGKTVFVWFFISGTSNSTGFTFSLPYPFNNSSNIMSSLFFPTMTVKDNGSFQASSGFLRIDASGTIAILSTDNNQNNWATSGEKQSSGSFFYETNT